MATVSNPVTPPTPGNTKKARKKKFETDSSLQQSINTPQKRRGRPKVVKASSMNPLEVLQNLTNEDDVVEFEVERIEDKEVDPISNQVWYWVKFKDISDPQRIAAEDCNCEDFIQEYERRISRNRRNNSKTNKSTSVSSPASPRSPTSIATHPPGFLSQHNNISTIDDSDSASEDDPSSDNEQEFDSWPKSVVAKRTLPTGEVQYKVKFESVFLRWVNPKTDNTSSRQTIQELCNDYEKAIANMTVKDEKAMEDLRKAKQQSADALKVSNNANNITNNNAVNNNTQLNNTNSTNNNNADDIVKLLVEEVKHLRLEQQNFRIQEEINRKNEEKRRQEWLEKVTSDLEERLRREETKLREKEQELSKKAKEQEDELVKKSKEADEKVTYAKQLLEKVVEHEQARLQESTSKMKELQRLADSTKAQAQAATPQPLHQHISVPLPQPHAASPSTDSGQSSPPGHSAPNTPSDDFLQQSVALMLQSDTSNPIDPILSVTSPSHDDMMDIGSSYPDTPRAFDVQRFFQQIPAHPPTTISPTSLHQHDWFYEMADQTEQWNELTDDLQKSTSDGVFLNTPSRPVSRPLHVPKLNLAQGQSAKLNNGDIVTFPGKAKTPKRKPKPKTDEAEKKTKKAVSKKTTVAPQKPPPLPKPLTT